ncbi:MAG TPA: hypothetical protein VF527_12800 [Pyrinomonadaceae bacterium]|jgi:hypothetical protein
MLDNLSADQITNLTNLVAAAIVASALFKQVVGNIGKVKISAAVKQILVISFGLPLIAASLAIVMLLMRWTFPDSIKPDDPNPASPTASPTPTPTPLPNIKRRPSATRSKPLRPNAVPPPTAQPVTVPTPQPAVQPTIVQPTVVQPTPTPQPSTSPPVCVTKPPAPLIAEKPDD